MDDLTSILNAIDQGDAHAASRLLPLVYDDLRRLAQQKLAREAPGQTLNATALVHEAYLRLVGKDGEPAWQSRGHYFAAAAEAMRRILVENARRKRSLKRGGGLVRADIEPSQIASPEVDDDILALDSALDKLGESEPRVADLVKLRYFSGLTIKQTAEVLNISPRTADSLWSYGRAWLKTELERGGQS
jgi:RNA polymerase sigma factor (TIGR02999 family)